MEVGEVRDGGSLRNALPVASKTQAYGSSRFSEERVEVFVACLHWGI